MLTKRVEIKGVELHFTTTSHSPGNKPSAKATDAPAGEAIII